MPKITKTFSHQLGKDEALRRIKAKLDEERVSKSNFVTSSAENWQDGHLDFSIVIFTYTVHGTLDVTETTLDVMLDLPVVAMMVQGMIKDQLQQEVDGLLA